MKILSEDLKHNRFTLQVESLDDLWNLFNIIEKDDLINSKTTREIKQEGYGRPSSRRVVLTIELEVLKTYFDRNLNRLRIHGVVKDAPEEYSIKGSHHTLDIEPNDILQIKKKRWYQHQIERLKKAVIPVKPVLLISINGDDAALAVIRSFDIKVKAEISSSIPGKRDVKSREGMLSKFFQEVTISLKTAYNNRETDIIIVGPGFMKEHYINYLKDKEANLFTKVKAVKTVGTGGISGIHEALRGGALKTVLKESRISEEMEYVEEVLRRLGQSKGDVSYGLDIVRYDAESGSIETLLVSIEKLKNDEERSLVEEVIKKVEDKQGKIIVISTDHEGGKKLSSLGGLAALLRYPRHY